MSVGAGDSATLDFGNYGKLGVDLGFGASSNTLGVYYDGTSASVLHYTISGGADAVASATIGGQLVTQGDSSVTLATGVKMNISGLSASDWASPDALNTALFGSTTGSATVTVSAGSPGLTLQTGANAGESITLSINDMSAAALGLTGGGMDISTQAGANAAITAVDNAISAVSSERAKLGAMQNRLEYTVKNLGTTSQNLTASESQIRDADMAEEMMAYTKSNILSQAATAMLAQANQQPQEVLQLLK